MALSADEKAVVQEALDKIEELSTIIRTSLPIRNTGGSHVFNELIVLKSKLAPLAQ